MLVRPIAESDAEDFLRLTRQLDQETAFMMLEPGERTTTVEEQLSRIRAVGQSPNQTIRVADDAGQLVGYIAVLGGAFRRNRHSAYRTVGILQAYAGPGLGRQLFTAAEE